MNASSGARIRPIKLADAPELARICVLTGAAGADATSLYSRPEFLAQVYAWPYLHGPGVFGFVVDVPQVVNYEVPPTDTKPVLAGYLVGTTDTVAFQQWFSESWWPQYEAQTQLTPADRALFELAADPERLLGAEVRAYPAHLHIDLLPEFQGQGWGRRLIEIAQNHLRELGVVGLHVVADSANLGARNFYPRVGFQNFRATDSAISFVCVLR